MGPDQLKQFLDEQGPIHGFTHGGWTRLEKPLSFDSYRTWIEQGRHGQMRYLEEHLPVKENPQRRYPQIRSAFVFAFPYLPAPAPEPLPLRHGRLALYARGEDYHFWLKRKLQSLITELQTRFPEADFEAHTDSSPLMERDLARRAGLGWVGKNTCVIHPQHGSLFLIGEVLCSLDAPSTELAPVPDFCGTCRRCIDICPTQALVEPRILDARKCISYLTIESREIMAPALRPAIGDWLFGCDLCQTVCPWNQKVFRGRNELETAPLRSLTDGDRQGLIEELRWMLTASGKALEKALRGTPLARAGSFGLKRNSLVVAANQNLRELRPEVENLTSHSRLGELAQWTLQAWEA